MVKSTNSTKPQPLFFSNQNGSISLEPQAKHLKLDFYLIPESVTSQRHIAQALDSTVVRKIPTEPTGAAQIFLFYCKTNILHSVLTLKSRIQALSIQTLHLKLVQCIDSAFITQIYTFWGFYAGF